MVNKNYQKGVRKERKIVNQARKLGYLSFRSAGSHSPIDVIIIDTKLKKIQLLQCKPNNITSNAREKILASLPEGGTYYIESDVV